MCTRMFQGHHLASCAISITPCLLPLTLQKQDIFACATPLPRVAHGHSAWWVDREQVSETAPTGEYLPAGSLRVRQEELFAAVAARTGFRDTVSD